VDSEARRRKQVVTAGSIERAQSYWHLPLVFVFPFFSHSLLHYPRVGPSEAPGRWEGGVPWGRCRWRTACNETCTTEMVPVWEGCVPWE